MPSGSMWPIPVQRTQTWLHPAGWSQGDPSSTTPPRLQALTSVLLGDFLLSGDSQEFWDRDSGKSNLSYMHGTFNGMLVCQKDVNWCSKEKHISSSNQDAWVKKITSGFLRAFSLPRGTLEEVILSLI